MKIKNAIWIGILILLAMSFFAYTNNNLLIQVYPKNNSIITERQPAFRWIGEADKLIIDDNEEFISPLVEDVNGTSYSIKKKLDFTKYYWRLIGKKNSSVWQFKVDSVVALVVKNESDLYNITNAGNTDLDIEIHEKNRSFRGITGNIILEENKFKQIEAKNLTLLIAKQR